MAAQLRLAVLVSGNGTALQNLLDAARGGRIPATVVRVLSSKSNVFALTRAEQAGVPTTVVDRKEVSLDEFRDRIFEQCRADQVDLVCMAGFIHLLPIPSDFRGKVMNVHPALIPAFCGKGYYGERVHREVLETGVKVSGCTVHFVDDEYDHGPIIVQEVVPVLDGDTPQTLSQRVFAAECEAYPEAIRLFAQGKLRIEGRRVRVLP
jgi:phosphoribosylglycinamide formyltransferase-1